MRHLVSACLAGCPCRWDGGSREDPEAVALVKSGQGLPVCPEQLGGLPTPREAAELVGGDGAAVLRGEARVATRSGKDVTGAFLRGAREAVRLARLFGAEAALLAARSPSCGTTSVHMDGAVRKGMGVAAAALAEAGVALREAQPVD